MDGSHRRRCTRRGAGVARAAAVGAYLFAVGLVGAEWLRPRPATSLSALRRGEAVVVDFTSEGCFHRYRSRIHFRPDGRGGLRVTSLPVVLGIPLPLHPLRVRLDAARARTLDARLSQYRNPDRRSFCTTEYRFRVVRYRYGLPVHRESFRSPCLGFAHPQIDIIDFDDLAADWF